MNRSTLKKSFLFFLPFVVCCAAFFFVAFLGDIYSQRITRFVGSLFGPGVTITEVTPSFLSGIDVTGISFSCEDGSEVSIDHVNLRFSLVKLFAKKINFEKVTIKNIRINKVILDIPHLKGYLSRLFIPALQHYPGDFQIVFEESRLYFKNAEIRMLNPQGNSDSLFLDFYLDIRRGKLRGEGTLETSRSSLLKRYASLVFAPSLDFLFEGQEMGADILVEIVKFSAGPYTVSSSGIIRDYLKGPTVDIKFHADPIGLVHVGVLQPLKPQRGEIGVIGFISGFFDNLNLYADVIIPSAEFLLETDRLSLDRFSCQLKYSFKNQLLQLTSLNGIIDDNFRISLTAKVFNIFSPRIDVQCELTPWSGAHQKTTPKSKIVIRSGGSLDGQRFTGNADVICYRGAGQQYTFAFKGLSLAKDLSQDAGEAFHLTSNTLEVNENNALPQNPGILQHLIFDGFDLHLRMIGKKTFIDEMHMNILGGKVWANGYAYFRKKLSDYNFLVVCEQIDFGDIRLSYPVNLEASGVLRGKMVLKNANGVNLRGFLIANEFELRRFDVLDKIVDFVGINSIRKISDASLIIEFDLFPGSSVITKFDLDAGVMKLRSEFNIDERRWLEGEVAVSLPRNMLEESKIFRTLLAIAREHEDQLDFNVRLSGFEGSLRTELVKSDLRDKLKERLSVGIQRYIEQEADKAVGAEP